MIGEVTRFREARVSLVLRGPANVAVSVEAVVDTGFDGELVVPREVIDKLGLRLRGVEQGTLADGSTASLPRYRARVEWDGQIRGVIVLAGDGALVGMSLMHKHRLTIDVVAGGRVLIEELK